MSDSFCAARERQPEQKQWHVRGCERALAFDARGNRTAWQKGLRVRNSPTCTLSQNGYGDEVARISARACANGFAEHSVQLRGWWLDAMIERSAHLPDTLALLLPGPQQNSATGTRTRVARVRAEYPNQLDYSGADT